MLYLLLWLGPVREKLRGVAQEQLSALLGADVGINSLEVIPFTRARLGDVSIVCRGDTVLTARELNAGVSGSNLLRGRLVITDVELMEPDVSIRREGPGAPLNIQPIIDKLKGDGTKPPTRFNLAVHTVVLRQGRAAYLEPGKELILNNLNADITAPRISSDGIIVSLKRLNFTESRGLELRNLAANVELKDNVLSLNGLELRLPQTALFFAPMTLDLKGRRIGEVEILRGSAVYPEEFGIPVPQLALSGRAELFRDSLNVSGLELSMPDAALALGVDGNGSRQSADFGALSLGVDAPSALAIVDRLHPLDEKLKQTLAPLGRVEFEGAAAWKHPKDLTITGLLSTALGALDIDADLAGGRLSGAVETPEGLDLAPLLPAVGLGEVDLAATFDLAPKKGSAAVTVARADWRGRRLRDVEANLAYDGHRYRASLESPDSAADLRAELVADLTPGAHSATLRANVNAFAPNALGLTDKLKGQTLSASVSGDFSGPTPWEPTGELTVRNLTLSDSTGVILREQPVVITSDFSKPTDRELVIASDLIDADARGEIDLRALPSLFRNLLATALPQYFAPAERDNSFGANNFRLRATVHNDAPLLGLVKLPVVPLYPVKITGNVSDAAATAIVDAPYLRKGNSLISKTRVEAALGEISSVRAATSMPTKFGDMAIALESELREGLATASLKLDNGAGEEYGGEIGLIAKPLSEGVDVHVLESRLTFDNVRWDIEPAFIGVRGKSVVVSGLSLARPGQELTVRGVASESPDDRLNVHLSNISLDYIFQTLRMAPTLQFGGSATGTVSGSALLSKEPILQTNDLFVKDFAYGHCVMGDAKILALWNNETHGIELHANVAGHVADGQTVVDGRIFPLSEELDFTFHARHTPVGFLKTFMSTWASDVSGYASGRCHLFGNFKDVDLEGDVMAENFILTVGFTNCQYFASDSVHIRPGVIDLSGITLRDAAGHTGRLDGRLTHDFFKTARFEFRISDLRDMLVLDTKPVGSDDRWYGKIYANGSAIISGAPGWVAIDATASSAPGSEFTFVLTDAASATEYNFLTFRDRTPAAPRVSSAPPAPGSPELDREMRAKVARAAETAAETTAFSFDFQIDATPDLKMTLVMDPRAGDKITGVGAGHIGVLYASSNDEMRLYGDYRIERGEYNFSLQDIILKNFAIKEGSEVTFHGDPMAAVLDISATYRVNANLSDLDESFMNDKEVQRTNVPVYAVLNVDGSLQDPQISFDLELPTMTADVTRKLKSIVSTEEMMNRQIIYLLALNRFYTPDYMASATKGNELMSVASGTISSQLSNILGQLSDKISVAPSLRSDADNLSDLEFDVALSSTLLNNRLLLNGNFGYRDKALNNNQFIGDFDVEYLLTRQGNWRLKAYNHFNDRNLYVKTALTTQGIGLVFKHDFD